MLYEYGFLSMFVPMSFFVTALESQADKYCREVYKDISLDKGDQYFDQVNEHGQQDEEG